MTAEPETFLLDADYLHGPQPVNLDAARRVLDGHAPPFSLSWDDDDPDLIHIEMEVAEFRRLQFRLLEHGIPVDLFHHIDDTHVLQVQGDRFRDRALRALGVTRHPSPRQVARTHFADCRAVLGASDVEEIVERVQEFRQTLLEMDAGRQFRFLRIGLELAQTDEELAIIAAGPLEAAAHGLDSGRDLNDVAHECAISPLLRTTCRDLVSTEGAPWGENTRTRWTEIIGPT